MVASVRAACRETDGHDPADEATELRLKHHGLTGSRLWLHGGEAFALLEDDALTLAVIPAARGTGLGAGLADVVAADTATAWSHGDHPAARSLAARHGFVAARQLWVMRRPAGTPLPPLETPDGVTVRSYRDEDAAAVVAVNAAAFADHPEQGAMDQANLAERMGEAWFDPAGLLVAVDGDGTLLGFHWTKQHDAAHGEVYVVGISPAAQGRGLGRVLTLAGLHHLAGRGVGEVLLYVESDNEPAVRLYRGLGFGHAPEDTHVRYARG